MISVVRLVPKDYQPVRAVRVTTDTEAEVRAWVATLAPRPRELAERLLDAFPPGHFLVVDEAEVSHWAQLYGPVYAASAEGLFAHLREVV